MSKTQRKAQPVFCLTFWVVVGYLESVTRHVMPVIQYPQCTQKIDIHIPGNSGDDFFWDGEFAWPFSKKKLLVSIQLRNQKVTDFSSPGFGKVLRNPINLIVGKKHFWDLSETVFFLFEGDVFFSGDDLKLENQQKSTKRPMMDVCQ